MTSSSLSLLVFFNLSFSFFSFSFSSSISLEIAPGSPLFLRRLRDVVDDLVERVADGLFRAFHRLLRGQGAALRLREVSFNENSDFKKSFCSKWIQSSTLAVSALLFAQEIILGS